MFKITLQLLAPKLNIFKIARKSNSDCDDSEKSNKSAFAEIKPVPPIEVFHLTKLFLEDKSENKVNLGVGAYRTDENKPFVLPVVKKCELEVVNDEKLNHEYLPILGNPDFTKAAMELLLGEGCVALEEKRVLAAQTLSGTGALRLAAEFLFQQMKRTVCYISNPTWENHAKIFKAAGFKEVKEYSYWNERRRNIDITKLLADLCEAPEGAVIIFHASAHNPTGIDPSRKQWKVIAEVMKSRKLFPLFDTAYQGFGSGNPEEDAWAVRHFIKEGFELLAAQSFSKNMGLYGERVGNLVLVMKDTKPIPATASQLSILVRINYSNPPAHGSRIVAKVLGNKENRAEWDETVNAMATRVKSMRKALSEKLKELGTPGKWDHIVKQNGMFSYTGLKPQHVEKLIKEKHIYMLKSGRINICGLTTKNVDYVATSISEVVKAGGDGGDGSGEDAAKGDDENKKCE